MGQVALAVSQHPGQLLPGQWFGVVFLQVKQQLVKRLIGPSGHRFQSHLLQHLSNQHLHIPLKHRLRCGFGVRFHHFQKGLQRAGFQTGPLRHHSEQGVRIGCQKGLRRNNQQKGPHLPAAVEAVDLIGKHRQKLPRLEPPIG